MDSGCPDCWGYNDSHPCLCHGQPDDGVFAEPPDQSVVTPESRDPAGADPRPVA